MLSREAKKKIHETDLPGAVTMESAIREATRTIDKAVKKSKAKLEKKDHTELFAMLTVLNLELAKKTEALRQANRGFDRLHRHIDRLRNERTMETAIFKRNMAMLHKQMFPMVGVSQEPFTITFQTDSDCKRG